MNQINRLLFSTLLFTALLCQVSWAKGTKNYNQQIRDLQSAINSKAYSDVYDQSWTLILQIMEDIQMNQVVEKSTRYFQEKQKEVITRKDDSWSKTSGGLRINLFLVRINIGGYRNTNRTFHETQTVTTNAGEKQKFEQLARQDLNEIRESLNQLLAQHVEEYILIKQLTIIALNAASEMYKKKYPIAPTPSELDELLSWTNHFTYIGQQDITRCVEVEHAAYTDQEGVDAGISAKGAIFLLMRASGNASHKASSKTQYFSYKDESCKVKRTQIKVNSDDHLYYKVSLRKVENQLSQWANSVMQIALFSFEPQDEYRTWGSPFFKDSN